jgi:hypothetical protein
MKRRQVDMGAVEFELYFEHNQFNLELFGRDEQEYFKTDSPCDFVVIKGNVEDAFQLLGCLGLEVMLVAVHSYDPKNQAIMNFLVMDNENAVKRLQSDTHCNDVEYQGELHTLGNEAHLILWK